jgi:nucleoside 2-deoxyribosyltransferase
VLVIMSYAERPELEDAYESFEQVVKELGYRCTKVTQANAGERILPDILDRIRRAAFTIVDLTDLRPNVFYELGYADGLGKKVVVTAMKGTELPFDVKDIPTIMWSGQKQLKEDLRARIMEIMPSAIPNASPPIGTL